MVEVISEADHELVYALRVVGRRFQPHVFAPGRYTVRVSEPDLDRQQVLIGRVARENLTDIKVITARL